MNRRRVVLDLTKVEADNLETLVHLGERYLESAYFDKPGQAAAARRAAQKLRRAVYGVK